MTNDKSGSPQCGIYVRIDDFSDMQKIITVFRQMTMVINRASGYKKNMNMVEFVYNSEHVQQITDLVILAKNEGIVAVVSGNMPDFECYGADGILLDNADDIKAAREKIGEDAIIGLNFTELNLAALKTIIPSYAVSNDAVSKAIGGGSDYVKLSSDPELISWWSGQTDILCVAVGDDITSSNCSSLALAGANFVEVSDYIFNYAQGTMQATVNLLHSLELCVQVPKFLN